MSTDRRPCGLVAILRGLSPTDAEQVGRILVEAGFRFLEVPLNSPYPLESISILRRTLPADVVIGAGTVLTVDDVQAVCAAGAQAVVSPNTDRDVVAASVAAGMISLPGVATVSEAMTAIRCGARTLKLFPAAQVGREAMRAWRAVLPPDVQLVPVGGVGPEELGPWISDGATGFGIGTALYRPDATPERIRAAAEDMVRAWNEAVPLLRALPG
ncbi:2-dehydro-3-deoxy-6-phosphogalactonate aldolase [Pseudonocardia nematodicida]|uniref:2-dehydro-3-deoxy-6-phosphogalactonate aldolase n=1 Tax=Pseudonocardia nematodicida TaxID=1206997 RepID=A0ABV1KG92_9PSEU